MFGMVLPIQKGRWNWSMDSKVKLKDVLESKRRLTAMRIRRRASRLKDMRTRRARKGMNVKCTGVQEDRPNLFVV